MPRDHNAAETTSSPMSKSCGACRGPPPNPPPSTSSVLPSGVISSRNRPGPRRWLPSAARRADGRRDAASIADECGAQPGLPTRNGARRPDSARASTMAAPSRSIECRRLPANGVGMRMSASERSRTSAPGTRRNAAAAQWPRRNHARAAAKRAAQPGDQRQRHQHQQQRQDEQVDRQRKQRDAMEIDAMGSVMASSTTSVTTMASPIVQHESHQPRENCASRIAAEDSR